MLNMLPPMRHILSEGEIPPFKVEHVTMPAGTIQRHYDHEQKRMVMARYKDTLRIVQLTEDGRTWMSDTPFEMEGVWEAVKAAHGAVLTSGLGIGLFPTLITYHKRVARIDIVERERKVVELVYPHIRTAKTCVIVDNVGHYLRTTHNRYDFIYLDVWGDIIGPLEDVDKYRKLAQRCLTPNGTVQVWLQGLIDCVKEKLPKEPTHSGGITMEPCLFCGKAPRNDYAGLCMDCVDGLGVSELFLPRKEAANAP